LLMQGVLLLSAALLVVHDHAEFVAPLALSLCATL
jgi:hypothetical protein